MKSQPSRPVFLARSNKKPKHMRKFTPLVEKDHILKLACPACHQQFQVGDVTALVPVGPGPNPDSQERAREGRPYNAVAVPVHWTCATGEPLSET